MASSDVVDMDTQNSEEIFNFEESDKKSKRSSPPMQTPARAERTYKDFVRG